MPMCSPPLLIHFLRPPPPICRTDEQMSCWVPQFKCPSSSDAHLRGPSLYAFHAKARGIVCFQSHCVLSPTATVIDIERIQIPSLEAHQTASAAMRPLRYLGAISPPAKDRVNFRKANFGATLDTESLFTGEEAVIAVAAAEAVALARAAVKVAKGAAQMIGKDLSVKLENSDDFLSEAEILQLETAIFNEIECVGSINDSATLEAQTCKTCISRYPFKDTGIYDLTDEFQQMLNSKCIAVKSGRQTERRARRARAGKAAASVVTLKSGPSIRKKYSALQEVDYSDPLRYLRGTTNTSKLLTAAEELELSEGIQDLLDLERCKEELAKRNGGQPTFAQWAEAAGVDQKSLRKRLNYSIFCKEKMIKSNIRLVISIAKNYQGAGMNLQDLVQEGCRGLVKGAEKFDASKGFKFSTYAHWWIKQAICRSLSDQSRTIRLPFHMVDATYRVREATRKLYSENGRYPEKEEVAEATGLSMRRLTAVMLTPKAPRSLDQKMGLSESLKPSDVIAAPDAQTPEEILMNEFMRQDLEKVLDSLNPREKQVVRWRFGLEDGRMKTLQEIGELMGVSRERIRQIESCAFRKLKNKRTMNLRQYLYL